MGKRVYLLLVLISALALLGNHFFAGKSTYMFTGVADWNPQGAVPTNQSYAFNEIQGVFHPVDFNALSLVDKGQVENMFLGAFPKYLKKQVKSLIPMVLQLSVFYKVDPFWVLSVMWVESFFDQNALSASGAVGMMQITSQTATHYKDLYIKYNLQALEAGYPKIQFKAPLGADYALERLAKKQSRFHMQDNIEMGICYLRYLWDDFNKNGEHATLAYNFGPYGMRKALSNNQALAKNNRYLERVKLTYHKLSQPFQYYFFSGQVAEK